MPKSATDIFLEQYDQPTSAKKKGGTDVLDLIEAHAAKKESVPGPNTITNAPQRTLYQKLFNTYGGIVDQALSGIPDAAMLAGDIGGGALGMLGGPAAPATVPLGAVAGGMTARPVGIEIEQALRNLIGLQRPREESLNQALQTGALSSAVGVGTGPALKMAGRGLGVKSLMGNQARKYATASFPTSTPLAQAERRAIIEGEGTLGEEAIERGIYGTRKPAAYAQADAMRQKFGKDLEVAFAKADKAKNYLELEKVFEPLQELKQNMLSTGRKSEAEFIDNKISDTLEYWQQKTKPEFVPLGKLGKTYISPSEANTLKKAFQAEARGAYKSAGAYKEAGVQAETAAEIASNIRSELEKIVPEAAFANKEYHIYDEIAQSLADTYSKDLARGGISLPTFGATGTGIAVGGAAGAPLAAGVYLGSKAFPVKTFLSAQLKAASKSMGNEAIMKNVAANFMAQPTLRRAVLRAIGRVGTAQGVKDLTQRQYMTEPQE